MGNQTPDPGGQPQQSPPGKEGQDIPKTGRDAAEPIDPDLPDEIPAGDDDDQDETGKIELPGGAGQDERRDRSRTPGNP